MRSPGFIKIGLLAELNQQNFYFAAIVGVDSTRRVHQGEAVLDRAAAARAHLPLVTNRNLDRDAGRDCATLARAISIVAPRSAIRSIPAACSL